MKRLAHDVISISSSYAGLAYDVTNTDGQTQNGRTHGRVFAIFKRRFYQTRPQID